MQLTLGSLLALASAALAIQVTSPAKNDQWDLSGDNKIEWNSVRYRLHIRVATTVPHRDG